MRTLVIVSILLFVSFQSYGQHLYPKFFLELGDTVQYHSLEWADLDNDGLKDIVVFSRNVNGEEVMLLFRSDTVAGPEFVHFINTQIKNAAFFITDFDGDNRIDVLVSGIRDDQPVTSAFLNQGTFVFEASIVMHLSADIIRLADFDQDGVMEILLSGGSNNNPFLGIFQRKDPGWVLVYDSIKIIAQGIEIFDFDNDNDADLFVSGTDGDNAPVTRSFYNQKDFYFTSERGITPLAGATNSADINHDGYFDVLVSGKDANDENLTLAFLNTVGAFTVKDSLRLPGDAEILAADFNSDGRCDISVFGLHGGTDTLNIVLRQNNTDTLPHKNVVTQRFGDFDYDGDLDLLQLSKSTERSGLLLSDNVTPAGNLPPGQPQKPFITTIFNRFFMYWDRSDDDHTPESSLTYDVSLQSAGDDLVTGHFDLFSGKRLLVRHGNNGTNNYVLITTDDTGGVIDFQIQAVDNAFHAAEDGVCRGSGVSCTETEILPVSACRNERVTLPGDAGALWFSFSDGFLNKTGDFTFQVQKADTVFSVTRQHSGCTLVKVYTVSIPTEMTRFVESVNYVCEGDLLEAGVEPGWPQVEWSSSAKGFLSNEDSIVYLVSVSDTLKVNISDGSGCNIQRNTALNISKPLIDVPHEAYQILKGESVQLNVSGGTAHQWAPASSLSDPHASNPVATPSKTTEYHLTVKDSIGCSVMKRVLVKVEETAFIPNLFTPNHDGSNDILKIYGLGYAIDFSFSIFTREGHQVYNTDRISQAVNEGWNGTAAGVDQPAGVYYWKVRGQTDTGQRLLLNGKDSGIIVLVR